jgi:hypothetical protein
MSKYAVEIKRLNYKPWDRPRYETTVYSISGNELLVGREYSWTLWGARRRAKQLVKKEESGISDPVTIEEYEL